MRVEPHSCLRQVQKLMCGTDCRSGSIVRLSSIQFPCSLRYVVYHYLVILGSERGHVKSPEFCVVSCFTTFNRGSISGTGS